MIYYGRWHAIDKSIFWFVRELCHARLWPGACVTAIKLAERYRTVPQSADDLLPPVFQRTTTNKQSSRVSCFIPFQKDWLRGSTKITFTHRAIVSWDNGSINSLGVPVGEGISEKILHL